MGFIDILFIIIFVYAIWAGYRSGLVVELCGILGVILGVWAAYKFSDRIFDYFNVESGVARIVGYVMIVVAVLLLVAMLAKLVSKVLDFSGLGIVNRLLGSAASLVKVVIVVSMFVMVFDTLNRSTRWVGNQKIDESTFYKPILGFSGTVFPFLGNFRGIINDGMQTLKDEFENIDSSATNKVDSLMLKTKND